MNRYSHRYSHFDERRYYTEHTRPRGKLFGVCAALAYQFNWDVALVRICTLLLFFVFSGPVLLAYLVLGLLL